MSYVSLAELISPFVEHPFDALQGISEGFPNGVMAAIERELWDGGWDSLKPWQRMHFAKQHDDECNPDNLRERRETTAAYAESVYNGTLIRWRYWVEQMPQLSAGEAARLMCALDPDIFKDLGNRPNKNDPRDLCSKAEMIQRLAERQGQLTATPTDWLEWAERQGIKVHDGFRMEVDSLGNGVSQQIEFTDTEAGVSTTYRMTQAEYDENQQEKRARQDRGYYTMGEVAQKLADTYNLDAVALLKRMKADYHAGNLTIRSRDTDAPVLQNHQLRDFYDWMFPDDIRAMLVQWKWSREFPFGAQDTAPATDATAGPVSVPVQTETPATVEGSSDGPAPLTTNEIANCFAGLREWDVARWKRELGSPDDWLKACQHRKGTRGRGGYESTWLPVQIAVALVKQDQKSARTLRARFKKQVPLQPWLDVFEINIPDHSDSQ